MSILFGIIHFDDKSIDKELLHQMYQPIQNFPQQRFDIIHHKEAGFGRVLRYQTPEDIFDNQPVYLPETNLLITAQGRIDNREELIKDLALQRFQNESDTFFIIKAYLKYTKKVQEKLKGDWSLVVYDYRSKELFMTRDAMGYTALYYYRSKNYFAFSTSIKSILALPQFPKVLNEKYFISFLSLWNIYELVKNNETLFNEVFFLKGGTTLTVNKKVSHINTYWPPENVIETQYKNKEDYAEQMLELMELSIKARLRSHKPVASMLSGGLDSSMVSYIAANLLKKQQNKLTTYSHVPLYKEEVNQNPTLKYRVLDETSFIQQVVNSSGNINPYLLKSADVSPWKGCTDSIQILDGFIHGALNAYWLTDIYNTCSSDGYGVLLTGEGGNGSTSFSGINYLREQSLQRFMNNPYMYFREQIAKPIALKYLRGNPAFNKLPSQIRNGYLTNNILEKYNIPFEVEKIDGGFLKFHADIFTKKNDYFDLYQMRSLLGANFGNYYGIELRDPTTDIDVMNYFLTIPNEVFFDDNFTNRMLVKRMMKNQIPDIVLHAKYKGLQSSDIEYRMKTTKTEFLEALQSIRKSDKIDYIIDLKKLEKDLLIVLSNEHRKNLIDVSITLKTLHAADFLNKHF